MEHYLLNHTVCPRLLIYNLLAKFSQLTQTKKKQKNAHNGRTRNLTDTEPLYTEIFQNVITPYGKVYTWEVKQKLMGRQSEETSRIMVSEYDLPITWQEFGEKVKEMGKQIMATATLLPGNYKCHDKPN